MIFDAYTLRAMVHQVAALVGSRVEKVQQPDEDRLVFVLFPAPDRRRLVLAAGRKVAGMALSLHRSANPSNPLHLCQAARAHLKNARLLGAEQLGLDRIFRLDFEASRSAGGGRRSLVGELFGAQPNLFLLNEEGAVLACLHHYPKDRRSRPQALWEAPAPREDLPPWEIGREAFLEAILDGEGRLRPRELGSAVAGLHPRLATALLGDAKSPDEAWERFRGLAEALRDHGYLPRILDKGLFALCPWPREEGRIPESLVEGIDEFLHGGDESEEGESLRRVCRRALRKGGERLDRELGHVRKALERAETAPELRLQAEALKQAMGQAKRGMDHIVVAEVWTAEGRHVDLRVSLDPRRDPKENLERLFARAKKLERSQETLETRLLLLEERKARFDELSTRLEGTDDVELLREIRETIALAGLADAPAPRDPSKGGRARRKERRFRRLRSSDGLTILVGRNGAENDALVKERARDRDYWLHAKDVPGAHVLVPLPDGIDSCPESSLLEAAQVALHFSKNRFAGKGEVMVARARDVRKAAKSPAGRVRVDVYRSLRVSADPEIVDRLAMASPLHVAGPKTDEHARLPKIPTREGFRT